MTQVVSLQDIKKMIDLYDPADDSADQLNYTLQKCKDQLSKLVEQRKDINEAIEELEDSISELEDYLSGKALDPASKKLA